MTHMADEIRQIPSVVARQLSDGLPAYREIGARLRRDPPALAVTCARGTSDHAATYFKYLAELGLGLPVASIGPSIASVYGAELRLPAALCLTVSQSGGSPDLGALQARARAAGAFAVALLNVTGSAVGRGAEAIAPMLAGPERAVAATKSYIASLVAIAAIVAEWREDAELTVALHGLPDALAAAVEQDWTAAIPPLAQARSIFTIARGPGLTVATEAALKFKETCRLHAEAYSAAEVQHGPIALAGAHFAALVFAPRDAARASVLDAAAAMREAGARVFVADPEGAADALPTTPAPHPLLDPITQAASFYAFVERMSVALGHDPDAPQHLKKVTKTR
jgi:glutamine---fructose-6-phosphate transaminase (isomerizing)